MTFTPRKSQYFLLSWFSGWKKSGLMCQQSAICACRSLWLVIVIKLVHCTLHKVWSLLVREKIALCLFWELVNYCNSFQIYRFTVFKLMLFFTRKQTANFFNKPMQFNSYRIYLPVHQQHNTILITLTTLDWIPSFCSKALSK